jgi:hypothetical protein
MPRLRGLSRAAGADVSALFARLEQEIGDVVDAPNRRLVEPARSST